VLNALSLVGRGKSIHVTRGLSGVQGIPFYMVRLSPLIRIYGLTIRLQGRSGAQSHGVTATEVKMEGKAEINEEKQWTISYGICLSRHFHCALCLCTIR